MSDTETNLSPDSKGSSGWLVIFLVVAPLLYVLSIGPVAALMSKRESDTATAVVGAIYAPVIWLHDHTMLKRPLKAYVKLWGAK